VYDHYSRWGQRGIWKGILMRWPKSERTASSSSTVPSSRLAARRLGQKSELAEGIGRSRGGRTSKVHAAVDEDVRPLRLEISDAQLHDSQMMDAFLNWAEKPLAIVVDKAYGSRKIRQQIADEGAVAVIPSKGNARKPIPHDTNLYAKRNIVARFFCKMKDMRRLATRFEKTATNFRSMLYILAVRCWRN
jgi:transposase